MKYYKEVIFSGFMILCSLVFADETDKTKVYCPRYITCDFEHRNSCYLSDNNYNVWSKPIFNNHRLKKGIYKFKRAIKNSRGPGRPGCEYYFDDKQPYPLSVVFEFVPEQNKVNYMFNLEPIYADEHKWNKSGVCESNKSHDCPFIQSNEIAMALYAGDSYMFYFPSENDWISNYDVYHVLQYQELAKRCGITSSCIIDVGYCSSDGLQCEQRAIVEVDLSKAKDISIISVDTIVNNGCVFKKNDSFNLISCE